MTTRRGLLALTSVLVLAAGLLLTAALGAGAPAGGQVPVSPVEADVPLPPVIPLFPLQDVMLFPNISRPFHIFEPRYRAMVADALKGDRVIGMVLLEPGHEAEYEGNPPIRSVGCAGAIADVEMFPDGRYDLQLRCVTRFRILDEDQSRAYRLATVEPLPEPMTAADRAALADQRVALEEAFAARVPDASPPPSNLTDEDFVNGLSQFLSLDPLDRQDLLERANPLARARALLDLMVRESTGGR